MLHPLTPADRRRIYIFSAVVLAHVALIYVLMMVRNASTQRELDAQTALTSVLFPRNYSVPADPAVAPTNGGEAAKEAARQVIDASNAISPTMVLPKPLSPADGDAVSVGTATAGAGGTGSGIGGGSGAGTGVVLPARPITVIPPSPVVVTPPAWVHMISDDELRPLLPPGVRRRRLVATARLSCIVLANSHVRDCRVLSETPAQSGMSDIVERASRYFRIRPVMRDGVPADGERVSIEWQVDMLPTKRIMLDMPIIVKP